MSAALNRRVASALREAADRFDAAAREEEASNYGVAGEMATRVAWSCLSQCLRDDYIILERRDVPRNPPPLDLSRPDQPDSLWLHHRGD